MEEWLILILLLLFLALAVGDLNKCIEYEKVGCFNDNLTNERPLPKLIENYRGAIDWFNLQQTLKRLVKVEDSAFIKGWFSKLTESKSYTFMDLVKTKQASKWEPLSSQKQSHKKPDCAYDSVTYDLVSSRLSESQMEGEENTNYNACFPGALNTDWLDSKR